MVHSDKPDSDYDEKIYHLERLHQKKSNVASFIVDTGAITHVVNNKNYFTTIRETNTKVNTVHGAKKINFVGTVKIETMYYIFHPQPKILLVYQRLLMVLATIWLNQITK